MIYGYSKTDVEKVVYAFYGGELNGMQMNNAEVEMIAEGHTPDRSMVREMGGLCQRKELDNQPTVAGYIGPMWDGVRYITKDGKVKYEFEVVDRMQIVSTFGVRRYETQEV